ncbi:proteasome subunit beta [Amycolatopsis sp. K13G38]|uniref:Proteasome subunit beta n=1 Tax=Amycolatopsis acididurans TaxID=2724524 RepID=A0ABX1J0Q0_9PSEU|nr:proteasome subunit beta [Amycolatopsis acididurans]NKQ52554.1 proteasome subunit beta [Amycolatopsis acididurans]
MENTSGISGSALPAAYFSSTSSSFTEFLKAQAPDLLPWHRQQATFTREVDAPHGTTIVAVTFAGGVLIAGDRRATSGNMIASRDIDKIMVADEYSAVGIAGTAGIGVEMAKLYSVELAHYEKIEGVALSLDGKTNKLANMVKGNLEAAMAGLVALPLFVGYDTEAEDPKRAGRIVSFDVAGGRYEENAGYHSIGSGSVFAKTSLKKSYDPDADEEAAIRAAVEAIYDAADEDTASAGPDMIRRIFPSIATITAERGAERLPDDQAAAVAEAVVRDRAERAAQGRS